MDAERFKRLGAGFESARSMTPDRQKRYLGEIASRDPELAAELRQLLDAHEQPDQAIDEARLALDRSLVGQVSAPGPGASPTHPDRIGRYHIRRVLGEGGMGTVYLAEQTEPVQREVALKVIKPGMDSRAIVARFEAERQTLAMMDHPGVVKVLDGGVTDRGLPYFVMELVRGESITEHCDRLRMTVPERVELFIRVCQIVQYAHMKGVIHRDLKPSNLVVERHGDASLPRIIDFGIARAIHSAAREDARLTAFGSLIGTPAYMSPEQASGRNDLIDTRSDVYSLGAVLYELLTGDTPVARNALETASLPDMQRMICDGDVIRPASRLARLSDSEARQCAERRSTEKGALRRRLRGELDWIVMKCLEKEPAWRYESAGLLATDLRRALENLPVSAGPPSTWYRLRKLAIRHQAAVVAAAVIVLMLILASGISVRYAWRESEQRRIAEEREAQLSEMLQFQTGMFDEINIEAMGLTMQSRMEERLRESLRAGEVDEEEAARTLENFDRIWRGIAPTDLAREVFDEHILRRASAALEKRFLDQPLVEASLRYALAVICGNVGMYAPGEAHSRRAHELRRRELGDDHPDTLRSLCRVAGFIELDERFAEAEVEYRRAYHGLRSALGDFHLDTRHAQVGYIRTLRLQHRHDEAEREVDLALRRGAERVSEDIAQADLFIEKARLALVRGDLDEAESLMGRTYEIRSRLLGVDDNHVLTALNDRGIIRMRLGRLEEAEADLAEVVARREALLGRRHPHTMIAMNNLALVYRRSGRLDDAEAMYREMLDVRRRVSGPDHSTTLTLELNLGILLQSQGRLDEAEPFIVRVYQHQLEKLGADRAETLAALNALGGLMQLRGRLEEADAMYGQVYAGRRALYGTHHRNTLTVMRNLFEVRVGRRDFARAETLCLEHYEAARAEQGEDHPGAIAAAELAWRLYTSWHQAEPELGYDRRAEAWKARLSGPVTGAP